MGDNDLAEVDDGHCDKAQNWHSCSHSEAAVVGTKTHGLSSGMNADVE